MHTLKLKEPYFNFIKDGSKRIELRLYDEKRQKVNLGDEITFLNLQDMEKSIKTKVIGLLRYQSFENLLKDFNVDILASKVTSKENLLKDLNEIYSKEKQAKYGIIGIKLELLN